MENVKAVWHTRLGHVMQWLLCLMFIAVVSVSQLSNAANNELQIPPNAVCACPAEVLIFNCTIIGGGATIWGGSAFICTTNEIILRHNTFSTEMPSGVCNGGAIIGESVEVQNNCYTSRLRVTVSTGLNNKTVYCLHNTDTGTMTEISEARISVISGPYQQAPTGVKITNVNTRQLTFSWISVDSQCPSIDYNITFSCGTCNVITKTTAICSDLQLPSECTFSVKSIICGHVGRASNPIRAKLKVPDKPAVDIIPVYSADTCALIRLKTIIDQEVSFNITNGISGSVTNYYISYSQTTTVTNFTRNSSCMESSCEYKVDVSTSLCPPSTDMNITLSASNILGSGPPSSPTTIGCKNQFVQVEYSSTTTAIICTFLDQMDTSVKSCTVMYGQCGRIPAFISQGNSTVETPNHIILNVDPGSLNCYVVMASSDTVTVIVEGRRMKTTRSGVNVIAAIVAPIGVFFIVMIIVLIVLVVAIKLKLKRYISGRRQPLEPDHIDDHVLAPVDSTESEKAKIKAQLNLQLVNKSWFKFLDIERNCELREFIEEQQLAFKTGCAFYEFEHDFEYISDDKRLLLMNENKELFSPGIDAEGLKSHQLMGNKVSRPSFKVFKVFVQSTGSGVRHLKGGTSILYQIQDQSQKIKSLTKLRPIVSNHFDKTTIESNMTIKKFREMNKLPANRCNIFLELKDVTLKKDKDLIDVILIDKKSTELLPLYSGPSAREIVKRKLDHEDRWRVFVMCKFDERVELKASTEVLHQNPKCTSGEFYELTVDEDNVRLSTFVKKKGYTFENGLAFYEFCRKEDLQCYKEVVHVYYEKDKMCQSSTDLFYAIRGAPGMVLDPPKVVGATVYLQSTSQGSRCLKRGTKLLYKKGREPFLYSMMSSIRAGIFGDQ